VPSRTKRPPRGGNAQGDGAADESRAVDERYGLEPVIEPAAGENAGAHAEGVRSVTVECPYCGESFETALDLSAGSTSYIEDCQVCCRPIEFDLDVEEDGKRGATLAGIRVGRSD
jgi:Cysteine-rich CPXCG